MGKPERSVSGRTAQLRGASLAVMALAMLTACAPDLGPLPQTQAAASYATTKSFAAPDAAWPSDAWWKTYGDSELDQLISVLRQLAFKGGGHA